MRKLSIFHCSTSVLLRWAESPRLRPTLKEPILITTIASQTKYPICPPTTKEGWISLIKDVMERAKFEPTDVSLINFAEEAMKRHSNPEPGRVMVHCELALLEQYKRQKGTTPPVNYIAVSKLSCEPCRLYIQAFNNSLYTTYCTAGGHEKYYNPWGAPSLGSTGFLNDLADSMSHGICERWTTRIEDPRLFLLNRSSSLPAEPFLVSLQRRIRKIGECHTVKSRYKKPPRDHQEVSYNEIYFPVQIEVGPGPCCLYREVSYIGGFLYRGFTVETQPVVQVTRLCCKKASGLY